MKKLIYQILIISIILSTIGMTPSLADSSLQHAIDYLQTNGYWKATGDFLPNQAATRAETASVMANFISDLEPTYSGEYSDVSASDFYASDIKLATNLGLITGAGGKFRPSDPITKQEFAVMIMRAYDAAGVDVHDSNYTTELIKDYEDIADWAKSSVTNALGNGILLGGLFKNYNPTDTVTRGELAEAIYTLHFATDPGREAYSVRDVKASDNIAENFTVINSSIYINSGVGGVGVVARFTAAPGEIYVRREKKEFDPNANNMAPAVTFARVIGPDGMVICRVDLDYLETGVMEKIINIPNGPAGIYQIQIINGNHLEPVSIGIKKGSYRSYGIRGEDHIMFTNSMEKKGYIYVPEVVSHLSIGIGGNNSTLKLYDATGETVLKEGTRTDKGVVYNTSPGYAYPIRLTVGKDVLVPDSVVMYEVSDNFNGRMQITGVTPIIYPSADYALDLKSGYIMHTDKYATLQLNGPLQVKARERMVEIYEEMKEAGNPEFAVDVSEYSTEFKKMTKASDFNDLDNPIAEAQLFSSAYASLSNTLGRIKGQCVDPTDKWFGSFVSAAQRAECDWQTEEYTDAARKEYSGIIQSHGTIFAGTLSINSELNAYYNHPVLAKRAELVTLFLITQMPAKGMFINKNTRGAACAQSYMEGENFGWGNHAMSEAYYYIRNHLSPETKRITDEGMMINADKTMNIMGQGPTNQMTMCMQGTVYMYKWSGEDRYHENFKRKAIAYTAPCIKDDYHGQSKLGYLIESGGADGNSYGRMGDALWYATVEAYLTLPESMKDPALVADMIEATNKLMKWNSYFKMHATDNFKAFHSSNWTSRVNVGLTGMGMTPTDAYVMRFFPLAKKNWTYSTLAATNEQDEYETTTNRGTSGSCAACITNEIQAKDHLASYVQHYDTDKLSGGKHSMMYYVWHQDQQFDDSEMPELPVEAKGGYNIFLDENGILSIKHQGIYMICYFNHAMSGSNMSYMSWLGGGPTSIWDDYFATTLVSKKIAHHLGGNESSVDGKAHENYNFGSYRGSNYRQVFTKVENEQTVEYKILPEDVLHSCIVGTDDEGNLIASGRENTKFSWIEKDKSFSLSGKDAVSQKTFTWDYYLTDDGISIEAKVDTVLDGEELYMQLPLVIQSGATCTFDEENKRVAIEHNGNAIYYQWYADNSRVELVTGQAVRYKYLKIRLTGALPYGIVKISRNIVSQ